MIARGPAVAFAGRLRNRGGGSLQIEELRGGHLEAVRRVLHVHRLLVSAVDWLAELGRQHHVLGELFIPKLRFSKPIFLQPKADVLIWE